MEAPGDRARGGRRAVLLVFATAATLVCLVLAIRVAGHAGGGLDSHVLGQLHMRRTPEMTWFFARFTHLGSWYVLGPIAVGIALVLVRRGMRRQAAFLALSLSTAVLVNLLIKAIVRRQPPGGDVRLVEAAHYSYPSGHTMSTTAFALALVAIAWPTRWRWPVLAGGVALALTMGFSRAYVGVHWPSDVLAGWLMGFVVVAVVAAIVPPGRRDKTTTSAVAEVEPAAPADGVRVVLFDWGNTLMVDDGQVGPMADWPRVTAVPGAAEVLAALHGRYRLCVATNADESGEAEVMEALDRVGLARFIDRVFSSRDLGARKPDPAFYAAVLDALRTDAAARGEPPLSVGQVIMVGDTYENDVLGALAAGLKAVWLDPSGALESRRASDAQVAIADPGDLPKVISDLRDLPRALAPARG